MLKRRNRDSALQQKKPIVQQQQDVIVNASGTFDSILHSNSRVLPQIQLIFPYLAPTTPTPSKVPTTSTLLSLILCLKSTKNTPPKFIHEFWVYCLNAYGEVVGSEKQTRWAELMGAVNSFICCESGNSNRIEFGDVARMAFEENKEIGREYARSYIEVNPDGKFVGACREMLTDSEEESPEPGIEQSELEPPSLVSLFDTLVIHEPAIKRDYRQMRRDRMERMFSDRGEDTQPGIQSIYSSLEPVTYLSDLISRIL
jgi:hypothetical protein